MHLNEQIHYALAVSHICYIATTTCKREEEINKNHLVGDILHYDWLTLAKWPAPSIVNKREDNSINERIKQNHRTTRPRSEKPGNQDTEKSTETEQ
jgi:hypothetical protein